MGALSPLHLILILVIVLLVIGPGKLPEVGSALGKGIRDFRKAASDVQEPVKLDVAVAPTVPTPIAPTAVAPAPASSVTDSLPATAAASDLGAPATPSRLAPATGATTEPRV